MGLKEKTVSSLKWNIIATVATMLIGLLQIAILTRLLDKSDFGLIAIASMVIAFTDIFAELGVTAALIHKQNISREVYSSVYWLNICMSMVVCGITVLCAPFVASFYEQPELTTIIRLLSLKMIISAFGKIFQTIKTKELEFDFISKVRILTSVVGIITSTVLAWLGFGVMSLVWGQLTQIVINQGIYAIAGWKNQRVMFHFSFVEVRDVFTIGGYQLGTQILDFVAGRIDVFLIGKFFTMGELGIYNIAKELIAKPYQIINSVTASVFSAAFAKIQNDIRAVVNNFKKLVKIVAMISSPVYAMVFIFADLIVAILYAPEFADVAYLIRILAFTGIISSVSSQGAPVMIAFGRTDLGLRWTFARIAMNTTALLLTASISLYAVAYGHLIFSTITISVYFLIVLKPIFNDVSLWDFFSMFGGIVLNIILISAPFAVINILFDIPVLIQIVMGIAYVSICYMYLKCYHQSELEEVLKNVIPKRFSKRL